MGSTKLQDGLLRVSQIVGDPKADPPITAIIPVSRSTWWAGVKSGRYPQPLKHLGDRITCWRASDIHALIENSAGAATHSDRNGEPSE
jgi:prophage regulatory protein